MEIRLPRGLGLVPICILLAGCGKPPSEKICNPSSKRELASSGDTKAPEAPEIPAAIKGSQATTLQYHIGSAGSCSAIKVAENLILSAAHCTSGYSGIEKKGPFWIEVRDKKHPLKIVDHGDFHPAEGKMGDWVLLEPEEGPAALSHLTIAEFPNQAELTRILANLGDFAGGKSGEAVWTVTYPTKSYRTYPRPAPDGGKVFLSRGFLTTEQAYRERVVYTYVTGHNLDTQYNLAPPIPKGVDINKEWDSLKNGNHGPIAQMHEKYQKFGDPILFHTADFAPGSSGGGVFVESTGHLLGNGPMKPTLFDPVTAYSGLGFLYRIDNICRESKILKRLPNCKDFSN